MVQSTLRCHRCDAPDAAVVKSSAICTMALACAGYVVADNYFELYVNGKLVGVDPVPFTPFNSIIVRFRVQETLHVRAESGGLGGEARPGHGDKSRKSRLHRLLGRWNRQRTPPAGSLRRSCGFLFAIVRTQTGGQPDSVAWHIG
jgi:hypothetical protein